MKRKTQRGDLDKSLEAESELSGCVAEMNGQLELAMHRDALKSARAILSDGELDADAFNEAVRVILVAENDCKPWITEIEAAYSRLSRREKADCADSMMAFYATVGEAKVAETYIRGKTTKPPILALQMDTLLELKRIDSAKTLFARCRRVLNKTHDSFERSTLLTAMAECCQRVGDLAVAERYWTESSELNEPALKRALSGLVRIQVARALCHVKEGIERIEKFWTQGYDENAIVLPGNHDQLLADARKELEGYRAALHTVVLPDELCQFGVGSDRKRNRRLICDD